MGEKKVLISNFYELPVFEGYSVDVRLKQFRKVRNYSIEFVDFNSEKGKIMLDKYIFSLDKESEEFKRIINYL